MCIRAMMPAKMLLNIDDSSRVEDPSSDELQTRICALRSEEFAILSQEEERFVQCYKNDDDDFELEFRDGSADAHFQIEHTDEATVLAGFEAYLAERFDAWQSTLVWKKLEFDADFQGDDFVTHWVIEGKEYPRIRVGKDKEALACAGCAAAQGSYHKQSCGLEACPRCAEPVQSCGCVSVLN